MSGPRSRTQLFDAAIKDGDLRNAWFHAIEIPYLTLERALRLTILMGREQSPGFEKTARRFLVRFLRECEPSIEAIKTTVYALDELRSEFDYALALKGLRDLAGEIERRGRGS